DALDEVELAERDAGPAEALRAARERMRREAEAAGVGDRAAQLGAGEAAVDLLVDPECQEVVAIGGGHLLADEDEHIAVPALLAAPLGLERVVVCEEDDVDAGLGRGAGDLRHGAGPV